MTAAPSATRPPLPIAPDDALPPWERDALRKLRLLRAGRKPAILIMSENGIIMIYRGVHEGAIAP